VRWRTSSRIFVEIHDEYEADADARLGVRARRGAGATMMPGVHPDANVELKG